MCSEGECDWGVRVMGRVCSEGECGWIVAGGCHASDTNDKSLSP